MPKFKVVFNVVDRRKMVVEAEDEYSAMSLVWKSFEGEDGPFELVAESDQMGLIDLSDMTATLIREKGGYKHARP